MGARGKQQYCDRPRGQQSMVQWLDGPGSCYTPSRGNDHIRNPYPRLDRAFLFTRSRFAQRALRRGFGVPRYRNRPGHLKRLGINTIEFLPVCEFNNEANRYDWGCTTVSYFAPEASYGSAPLQGSQNYEFKTLVNSLYEQGFDVMLDVVYNHVGSSNSSA